MSDRRDGDRGSSTLDVFGVLDGLSALDASPLGDVAMELQNGFEQVGLDPAILERTLDGAALPSGEALDVETVTRPDAVVKDTEPEAVVDTGGQAVDVMIEGSGEAASVLVDTGNDVVEVTTEGGEAAAEATAEVLVAALEGL